MKISTAFPSNYLRAADLDGRTAKVTMAHVRMEDIGGDHKPVLYFEGKEKGMVLNKTNANNIMAAYGDDTDGWGGGEVELFSTMVDFQGRSVEAIRVRVPPRRAQPADNIAPNARARAGTDERNPPPPLNDDIPF